MSDTFLSALTAAGGNSRAARSLRAKLQWRDRFGRWIEMGRGVKFKVRGSDGSTRSVIGSFVGAIDSDTGQVYVSKDPNGIPDGFYDIKSNNAQEFVANLTPEQLAGRGIELGKDASGNAVGERVAEDIPNINELTVKAAPEGWTAQPGTFGGKKVIQTEDGDFRVHYSGKDETVLLEDHRANPGQAEPQRSLAEAFKKVADVDIQREEGGDQAYVGLGSEEENASKLANRSRDEKIDQIKANERTLANERAPLGAKQTAMTANEQLKAELESEGQPYDPEGGDSDEALAARKGAAPAETPVDNTKPTVSAGDIDVSTFDVAPEGFLVPTGKKTNDITPEGLANFMTAEKEQLGKGGARLVVDTDAGTAEAYNSADTFDNAKAQAGGIGVPEVLDLAAGKSVPVADADAVVDPNSPEVNPNLEGDTSPNAPTGGAPDAEDRDPDAVEPGTAQPGADAPASDQPNAEAQRTAEPDLPAATGDRAPADSPDTGADDTADRPSTDTEPSRPSAAPGSVEELKSRRAKIQAALDNTGDPKDIVALNEQADELDTRIAVMEGETSAPDEAPTTQPLERGPGRDISERMTSNEQEREDLSGLLERADGDWNNLSPDDIDALEARADKAEKKADDLSATLTRLTEREIPRLEKEYEDLQRQFDEANGVQALDFDADRSAPEASEAPEAAEETLQSRLDAAWNATDPYPESNLERRERAALRILRDAEKKGDLEKGLARLSQEEKDALSDDIASAVGIERTPDAPVTPEDAPETSPEPVDAPAAPEAAPAAPAPTNDLQAELDRARMDERAARSVDDFAGAAAASRRALDILREMQRETPAPAAAPEREPYQEPGDATAVAAARAELDAIDAEIESELSLAETATDPQVQAGHLSRVRTLNRQRKIQDNALNRALGNAPMDLNRDLGWNMRDPENRGSLPEAPAPAPEAPEVEPEADTPAVLDGDLTPDAPVALRDVGPAALRVGDYIEHPETGNIVRITNIESERFPEEGATRFTISYESRNQDEEDENEAAGLVELWSNGSVDTFTGWRDQPQADAPESEVVPEIVSVLQKELAGEELSAEERAVLDTREAERANRTLEDDLDDAERALEGAERDYTTALLEDDFDEETVDRLENERDWARYEVQDIRRRIADRDAEASREELQAELDAEDRSSDEAADAAAREYQEEGPLTDEQFEALVEQANVGQEINAAIEERDEILSQIDETETPSGVFAPGDDPTNVSPGHNNAVAVAKTKLRGKQLTADERDALDAALESGVLTDNEVSRIMAEIDSKPNAANTITIVRPDTEQPDYMSSADLDIVNLEREDPNFVFDEDLTYRRIREEFPDAIELANGDLILDEAENKGKRYQTVIRRTAKNRFMVYVMETDGKGVRRAKRIGNTEWHSYEALEKRIQQGRVLIHSKSPAGSLARRKDQPTEFLGTQGFPADDFLGDIGNPDAPVPATGDEKFDRLLEVAAKHIRDGDVDLHGIEASLQNLDPGANAINTIIDAIIGRAQDAYRPNGTNPWQTYDGEVAEIGAEYDWTDWHQELNWWLPNGQLNPDRKPNPTYGEVHRVRVVKYVEENTDGKGHTYGDHVWVQVQQPDGSWSNWTKRSAQTLRRAEPGTAVGDPFFSKREEWRSSPEALARRFRVPTQDEPVQTKERPRRDLPTSRRLRFTSRGSLSGYSNVPVPNSPAEIAGMLVNGDVLPQMTTVADLRPGMLIVRLDDEGRQHVDSIIRVENLGDGGFRVHAARPDGTGSADVENFVLPEGMDVATFTAPALPAPRRAEPKNARRGELVEFDRGNGVVRGVVAYDDDQGNLTVITPGNETIDILESNIRPVTDGEVSKEDRLDLLDSLQDYDLPEYIKNMITQGVMSASMSRDFYELLQDVVSSFGTRSAQRREVDEILDMIGASDQQRADVHAYFAA